MFAVIFEVKPKSERWDQYLGYAKLLKPELEAVRGFIANERFRSKRREGWLLSLSTWQDEKALIRWRTHALHHDVQEKGRFEVFEDYHLRVGEITADSETPPGKRQRMDGTVAGKAPAVTITEAMLGEQSAAPEALAARLGGDVQGCAEWDVFESIYRPGAFLLLCSWRDGAAAETWRPETPTATHHRGVRIIRDYGMFSREEAPQYYRPVERM